MKIKFNSILLLSIILSCILIVSCKKEQSPNGQNEIPANDLRLANMIKNFRAKGESGLKSTSEMSIDSAIWYIGATANFTYGDASRETERTWTDSIFISLPVTSGKISESEVFNKYEQVIDSLKTIYQAKNEENKQLLAVAVETHSINTNSLTCKVTGIFAYGFPSIPYTFNEIDSWFFWWQVQGGICDGPNSGTQLQSDAAKETEKRITYSKAVPVGNYWYDPLPEPIKILNPILYPINPNNPTPNNLRYSHLYWNSTEFPFFDGCIKPADLNFYLANTKELIYNDTENGGIRPVGTSFIDIDMWGITVDQITPPATLYMHRADVYYGYLHWNPSPPSTLD